MSEKEEETIQEETKLKEDPKKKKEEEKTEKIEEKKKKKKKKGWLPLESNYNLLNAYMKMFGASDKYSFGDIYGFGDEINWVPQPCHAVLLLFPITEENEKWRKKEEEDTFKNNKVPKGSYFIKQNIGNACGTIALLHILGNNNIPLTGKCKTFFEKTKDMNGEERAKFLDDFTFIEEVHKKQATSKDSVKLKKEDLKTWKHFITFVNVDDNLMEFDGRRNVPLNRGKTSKKSFLKDVATTVKELIKISNKQYGFAALYYSKVKF